MVYFEHAHLKRSTNANGMAYLLNNTEVGKLTETE